MHSQPGRLITPEAVKLEVRLAGPGTRIAARGLDAVIQGALIGLLIVVLTIAGRATSGGTALVIIGLVGAFLVVFGYPAIMEATWRGRTLGKAAFGLRVVTSQGAPITFRHAAIRSALWVVDGLLIGPVVGVICLLVTRDTVRVGDMAAGTVVLRERSGAAPPSAMSFPVPPGWERYVASLDVRTVGADDYALVRSFLIRSPRLLPPARARLALDIAERTAGRLRLAPPGMSPDLFLRCVAAAVQQRAATSGARPAPEATSTVGTSVPPAVPGGWAQLSGPPPAPPGPAGASEAQPPRPDSGWATPT